MPRRARLGLHDRAGQHDVWRRRHRADDSAQGWREVDLAKMDHSVETTPVPLYRGLDVRPFEFGAAAATAEL